MATQLHKGHWGHGYAGGNLSPYRPQTCWEVRGIHEEDKKNESLIEQHA